MKDIKISRFLHRNQHTQRKFWYLVDEKNGEPTKIEHFGFSESILEVKKQLNVSKYEMVLRKVN